MPCQRASARPFLLLHLLLLSAAVHHCRAFNIHAVPYKQIFLRAILKCSYRGKISDARTSKRCVRDCRRYRVSVKSLYNLKDLLRRQMKGQISGNYYKMTRIHLSFFFFFFLPRLVHFYMSTISYTKHIKTALDFLHDRCFFCSDVLGGPLLPLSNTVPAFKNFLRHARIDGRDGGSLPYLVHSSFAESAFNKP